MRRTFWFALLSLAAATARAQSVGGTLTSPYDMRLPAASVASCDDPLATVFNPSALHWGPSFEVLFLHEERLQLDQQARARGEGLFFKLGALGFGLEYAHPDFDDDRKDYLKYTLSASLLHFGEWFALGAGLEILDPTETNEDPKVDWLLGAMIRPVRFLSLGVVGRNLSTADISKQQLSHRSLDLGLAVRPLWFDPERLTLAVDARLVDDPDHADPPVRFTGQFAIIDGLSLFGTADLNGNFGVGLMFDFQRFGIGSYVGFTNNDGVNAASVLAVARASTDSRPGFILVKDKTIELVLNHELNTSGAPEFRLFGHRPTVEELERFIRHAQDDPEIDSLLLKVEDPELRVTDVQELREAIADFRKAGKKVFVHLQEADNLRYYLATAANFITLAPGGTFHVLGPKVEATFFKGTLEWIGAKVEVGRAGKYKSAVEPFTDSAPSEAYREVMNSLADEFSDQVIGAIAEGRDFSRVQMQQLVDRGLMSPQEAKDNGLVDEVAHYDAIEPLLAKVLGHAPFRTGSASGQHRNQDRWNAPPTIAIVYASGTITYGGGLGSGFDGREIASVLSSLREDQGVDAVVLRVDSPGGSGMASDLVWREMVRLRERKPVIVSMSSLAASGGYWISCPADWILADPGTITGSIGVFAMLLDLSELYGKLGITHETVKRGAHADFDSTFRARTPEELELLQKSVAAFYQDFIQKVADGRKLTTAEVDEVGQGRVWTGRQAQKAGLVDELGGLSMAITAARERIGLKPGEEVRLAHLPRAHLSLMALLHEMGILAEEPAPLPLPPVLRSSLAQLALLATLSSEPIVAMLPFMIQVH